jgi:methylphosphotriester-DNA--protein-cysteine methyltransferase
MYRALVERDQTFEGLFFACVRTTGIFCRPTCHARKPKPENVEFAPTIQEALHRGYRPCQLCEPMSSGTAAPNWLAPLLDEIKENPDLKLRDLDLRVRGLDPVQVRRTFKRSFGMTFQAYQRASVSARDEARRRRTLDGLTRVRTDSASRGAREGARRRADARERRCSSRLDRNAAGTMLAIAGDEGQLLSSSIVALSDQCASSRQMNA